MIGIYSSGIWRIPHLANFLRERCHKVALRHALPAEVDAIAVWGYRPSGKKEVRAAQSAGKTLMRLEDGFIRSQGLGVEGASPFSMVVDRLGMYYDAGRPSTLERMIQDTPGNSVLAAEAEDAMRTIVNEDLSKFNHALPFKRTTPIPSEVVLVVDQTAGDLSVKWGGGGATDFSRMVNAALSENPNATIWVKVHPDVLSGSRQGYLGAVELDDRVHLFTEDVSPQSLLRVVTKVYVVTSQLGFEALLAGKPVVCFGLPWYAAWGLTDDRHSGAVCLAQRRGRASLTALFTAAYLRYSRYIHPSSGQPARLSEVLEWLVRERRHGLQRVGHLWAPGLPLWKATMVKPFLHTRDNQLTMARRCRPAEACVVWGIKGERRWSKLAQQRGIPVWRMENGLLRSSGHGSAQKPPLSLVLDKQGIYYDARRPSDLEQMLNNSQLSAQQATRAQRLHQRLVEQRTGKQNVGHFRLPDAAAHRLAILVLGQVEDDISLATGALGVRTNHDLLHRVREDYPQAFIFYKPHPDSLKGDMKGDISPDALSGLADFDARDVDIIQCITQADEVHTMTSLWGFEALLHGKRVHCYGLPFYAGWGLTDDEFPCARRTRKLTRNDLIYQGLIAYPTYLDPHNYTVISPEDAVEILVETPHGRPCTMKRIRRRIRHYFRQLMMFIKLKLF
ncbi:Capsule polysaccharide export protein kpsC [Erwinia amylovora Ea644]|uniref:capsular polysaccharide biosynthesis protein n=1 Tax=Erwinia amylovora TaxID=552 RepID=UPI0002C8D75F|nr:capsular polysaccharide biosynthesis protein [Erwinia amylovora]CCP03963.1 Capsule polysaccharide export protein kpsC [Erwinia amylovora Ea644]